jgi:SAM-dependent methyltransferase
MWIDRSSLRTIRTRRAELRRELMEQHDFEVLEESCIPSYCHANRLAAATAWWRLLTARALYLRHARPGPILDFGAGSGELFHLLDVGDAYHFVEENETLAGALVRRVPGARREHLDAIPPERFAWIFALDALEHNRDVAGIVDRLVPGLRPDGCLLVSGPTENALYRLGRRIAGFGGHYHSVTIYDIEAVLAERLERVGKRSLPVALPLFRLSLWRRRRVGK